MKAANLAIILLMLSVVAADAQFSYATLPFSAAGISGNNIVGTFSDNAGNHGYFYDGSTYITLDDPLSRPGNTLVNGVSGDEIVGYYYGDVDGTAHGFLYQDGAYQTLENPLGNFTVAEGISGNKIVGYFYAANLNAGPHGFFYNGSNYSILDDPLGRTFPMAVSGDKIVGFYEGKDGFTHGFLYDGGNFRTLDDPSGIHGTVVSGISGNNLVGYYTDSTGFHGFLYDGTTFTTLDDPLAVNGTFANSISGDEVVGYYYGDDWAHGFIVTVPEPSVLTVFTIGVGALLCSRLGVIGVVRFE